MTTLDLDATRAFAARVQADTDSRVPATDFEDRSNVRGLLYEHAALVAEVERLEAIVAEQRRIVFDPVSDYYGEIRVKFEALDDTRTAAPSSSDSSSTGGEL